MGSQSWGMSPDQPDQPGQPDQLVHPIVGCVAAVEAALKDVAGVEPAFMRPGEKAEVLRRLLAAPTAGADEGDTLFSWSGPIGRPGLSILSANRQGVTVRLHAGSGATPAQLADALREALRDLDRKGMGLKR